uniref:Immunoglobulin V-set domain-containing protein n=1 Tax=Aquila chrysaetos chrysaetos TaxID=223781 RepID=A0A663DMC8_AQUCH
LHASSILKPSSYPETPLSSLPFLHVCRHEFAFLINCSHPNIQTGDYIHWYRQLPGRGPAFLVSTLKDSKKLTDPPGRLSVAADRRSSALWLARPRRGDAAVYYCALRDTGRGIGEELELGTC